MPLRSDWSGNLCPMARSLDVLGDPWLMLIVREALTGATRYEQFRSALGMSDNVLAARLRAMVEAGLFERVPYRGEQRTHDEYLLTEAGADLLPVVHALFQWGERHTTAPGGGGRVRVVHRPCGQTTDRPDVCSHCGAELRPEEVAWVRPWHPSRRTDLVGPRG